MVRFTALILSAWVSQSVLGDTSSRLSIHTKSRNLSAGKIAGYNPDSKVTDHNALDMDQYYMEIELAKETSTGQTNAENIYKKGGNSKSYAVITLTTSLSIGIDSGTAVKGTAENGDAVEGELYKDAIAGRKIVKIRYNISAVQKTHVMCRVGALQQDGLTTSGCLKETGSIVIAGKTYPYTYKIESNNMNGRTLQGFSTAVEGKMLDCSPGCPFTDAKMFSDYYGQPNYGDMWIMAAFNKGSTDFTNGNADFSEWGYDGRNEAIKKGTVYLNVFMYVIREFEDAIVDCKTQCDVESTCNDGPVFSWDEGVAFYTGSREGTDGVEAGVMLHQLADKRCQNFKTCGINGDLNSSTRSQVNHQLLTLFEQGKDYLQSGKCGKVKILLKEIIQKMYIPFIQGSLRYAYKLDEGDGGNEKQQGEAAIFTAAVLPRIHAADKEAAKILYDNMRVGTTGTSFSAVKKAYESVYKELGLTCEDVGGLASSGDGTYYKGTQPCNSRSLGISTSSGSKKGLIVATVGTIAVILSSIM